MDFVSKEVLTAGVDWITITSVTRDMSMRLMTIAEGYEQDLGLKPGERDSWGAMGYRGWRAGPIKVGARGDDETMLIVSGAEANDVILKYDVPDDRVTRVDLQVTCVPDEPLPDYAMHLYKTFANLPGTSRYDKLLTYISSATGDTLYIGKRGGNCMMRIYDKTYDIMPGQLGYAWRFEAEYRRKAAKLVTNRLNSAHSLTHYIMGQVAAELKRRKIDLALAKAEPQTVIEVGATVTSPEQKIKWLGRCVSPVVHRLWALGYEEEVLNALKLKHLLKGE